MGTMIIIIFCHLEPGRAAAGQLGQRGALCERALAPLLLEPGHAPAPLPPLLHDHVPAPLPRPPASRHCQPLLRQPGTGEKNHTEGKCKGRRC